jgi:Extensin-like protein C-terminus
MEGLLPNGGRPFSFLKQHGTGRLGSSTGSRLPPALKDFSRPYRILGAMGVRVAYLIASLAIVSGVAACAFNPYSEPRAAWRGEVEAACLASGEVTPSAFVQPLSPLGGRGSCGLEHPFRISAALNGTVAVTPPAVIGCPMTASLDRWITRSVQPAARAYFASRVVEIKQIASYGCRTRDNLGVKLSEHAFGNALDVAAFRLADGREIVVLRDWSRGTPAARAFLQAAFAGACAEFYTVLGPGSDAYHSNHFHLDLLRTNARNGRHFCQPAPYGGGPVAQLPVGESVGAVAKTPLSFVGTGREAY